MKPSDPSSRVLFDSVHDAAQFHSSALWYPLSGLRKVTPEQHAKIRSLGGVLLVLTLDTGSCLGAYVFDNRVLGLMAMAYTEPQNQPHTNKLRPLWQEVIDDCPTLQDVADRYFNDNEPGTLDLVHMTARFAA